MFLICAEGLSALLKRAELKGEIHGVKIARGVPAISHMLFADDSLFFLRANEGEADAISEILNTYELASG